MKILVLLAACLLVLSVNAAPRPTSCYWDIDCSASHSECCVGNRCRSENSCQVLRAYPLPNFQACFKQTDCQSGCCHNNFCTMAETCDVSDATTPLILFLVVVAAITALFLSALIKDVIMHRRKRAMEEAGIYNEGAKKNS
jgi:hypothetical protein